jgi:hypothetical protein
MLRPAGHERVMTLDDYRLHSPSARVSRAERAGVERAVESSESRVSPTS